MLALVKIQIIGFTSVTGRESASSRCATKGVTGANAGLEDSSSFVYPHTKQIKKVSNKVENK